MGRHPVPPIHEIQRALFRADLSIKSGSFSLTEAGELLQIAQTLADSIEDSYDACGWNSRSSIVSSLRGIISDLEEYDPAGLLTGQTLGRAL